MQTLIHDASLQNFQIFQLQIRVGVHFLPFYPSKNSRNPIYRALSRLFHQFTTKNPSSLRLIDALPSVYAAIAPRIST
jgi:hypothetical protein